MKLIGLTGYARSGKDTVGKALIESHGFERVGFADAVRESIYALDPLVPDPWLSRDYTGPGSPSIRMREIVDLHGWEWAKSNVPEVRQLLQRMGTEVGRNIMSPTIWTDIAVRKISELAGSESCLIGYEARVVVTDVRFANEAALIRDLGGRVWKVERIGTGPVNNHPSERLNFEADAIIENHSDLPTLFTKVDALLRSMV